jgi:hypothetical protein
VRQTRRSAKPWRDFCGGDRGLGPTDYDAAALAKYFADEDQVR